MLLWLDMIGHFGLYLIFSIINIVTLEDIRDLNINDLLKLADDVSQIKIGDVNNDDIKFYLSTRTVPKPTIIDNGSKNAIDLSKPTKFIIHGWIANSKRSWYRRITEEFLKNGDYNVIQVDWERPARSAYVSSAINTKLIGQRVAQLIIDIQIPPRSIHLVGHSLGAHIAGFAAKITVKKTGKRISRISGLDPAGPYFREYFFVREERLDKDDAKIVDVIHTDAGVYGVDFPIGTLDIYANGGRGPQPGCLESLNVMSFGELIEHSYCNHARSANYFIDWINNGKFHCKLCKSWEDFSSNKCDKTIHFGEEDVDENVVGICVSRTLKHEPYLHN